MEMEKPESHGQRLIFAVDKATKRHTLLHEFDFLTPDETENLTTRAGILTQVEREASCRGLPDQLGSESLEGWGAGHKRRRFERALRRQHAIERIPVIDHVSACLQGMQVGDGKMLETVRLEQFVEAGDGLFSHRQLAGPVLALTNITLASCTLIISAMSNPGLVELGD